MESFKRICTGDKLVNKAFWGFPPSPDNLLKFISIEVFLEGELVFYMRNNHFRNLGFWEWLVAWDMTTLGS